MSGTIRGPWISALLLLFMTGNTIATAATASASATTAAASTIATAATPAATTTASAAPTKRAAAHPDLSGFWRLSDKIPADKQLMQRLPPNTAVLADTG